MIPDNLLSVVNGLDNDLNDIASPLYFMQIGYDNILIVCGVSDINHGTPGR